MSLRKRRGSRVRSATTPLTSVNSRSSDSRRRSVAGIFKEKMEDDTLELPLLPLREGELEERLNEMDTSQVKFMIPRVAMLNQSRRSNTPNISDGETAGSLDSDELAMVRPNAEVIREIREIKKLQFSCGVAIVLVMIVGVLVLACGIGFIIFHAAKLNRQIALGKEILDQANHFLQTDAKPLLDHVKSTLDEGIGHIDILVNTQMENLMRVLNGDNGLEESEKGPGDNILKTIQRSIGGTRIGNKIVNHSKRESPSMLKVASDLATASMNTTGSMVSGAASNVKNTLTCAEEGADKATA